MRQADDFSMKRKVTILVFGTGSGQAVQFICLPFVARFFTPEALGSYGALLAFSTILSVFIGMRLEVDYVALRDLEKNSLTKTFVIVSVVTSVLIFLLLSSGLFDFAIPFSEGAGLEIYLYLTLLALSLALFEFNIVSLASDSRIKLLALVKGMRGAFTSLLQIVVGFMGFITFQALVISDLIIRGLSSFNNGFSFWKGKFNINYITSSGRLHLVFASFLNKLALNAPFFLIGYIWGVSYVGFYKIVSANAHKHKERQSVNCAFCCYYFNIISNYRRFT